MLVSNSAPFDQAFDFSRAREAAFRNAEGELDQADYDVPRLDHDEFGDPIGLLIEGNPDTITIDNCRVTFAGVAGGQSGTVLHELVNHRGQHKRVAFYTEDARATIDARLAIRGHHRQLMFFPVFRTNLGGFVRFAHVRWDLPAGLDAGAGGVLGSGGNLFTGAV